MISLSAVVRNIFAHRPPQRAVAKEDDLRQALILDRSDPPLDVALDPSAEIAWIMWLSSASSIFITCSAAIENTIYSPSTLGVGEGCANSTRPSQSRPLAELTNSRWTAPPIRPSLSFRQGQLLPRCWETTVGIRSRSVANEESANSV